MFNEYMLIDSMFPGSVYENPTNEKIRYDPQKALQLLAEAGWKERDANGRLTRNGQPLTIEIVYAQQASERYFTIYQEDLRRVGITLNLRFTTLETLVKLLDDRTFGMVSIAYTGEIFPKPEPTGCRSLPTRRTRTTSPASRTPRADEIMTRTRRSSTSTSASRCCRNSTGSSRTSTTGSSNGPRRTSASCSGTSSAIRRDTSPASAASATSCCCGGSIPKRAASSTNALGILVQLGQGPSDDKYWLEFAKRRIPGDPGTR